MSKQTGLRSRVVDALNKRTGSLRSIADKSGISYDTVLRIKNQENDPGYSKVVNLAVALGVIDARAADPVPEAARVS